MFNSFFFSFFWCWARCLFRFSFFFFFLFLPDVAFFFFFWFFCFFFFHTQASILDIDLLTCSYINQIYALKINPKVSLIPNLQQNHAVQIQLDMISINEFSFGMKKEKVQSFSKKKKRVQVCWLCFTTLMQRVGTLKDFFFFLIVLFIIYIMM